MPTIVVEPELYKRFEEAAIEQKASVDKMLDEAVRYYLWELDRKKISEESKRYRQLHAELRAKHLGKYIAMLNGEVVDNDADFQVLHQRVRQRFGRKPVMITLVQEAAEPTLTRRGFVMETSNP